MSNPTGINQYTKGRGSKTLGKSAASRRKQFSAAPREFMTAYKNERSNYGSSRREALFRAAKSTQLLVARGKRK